MSAAVDVPAAPPRDRMPVGERVLRWFVAPPGDAAPGDAAPGDAPLPSSVRSGDLDDAREGAGAALRDAIRADLVQADAVAPDAVSAHPPRPGREAPWLPPQPAAVVSERPSAAPADGSATRPHLAAPPPSAAATRTHTAAPPPDGAPTTPLALAAPRRPVRPSPSPATTASPPRPHAAPTRARRRAMRSVGPHATTVEPGGPALWEDSSQHAAETRSTEAGGVIPRRVAVLGPAPHATAVAAAVAGELRAPAAVVCAWSGEVEAPVELAAPATRAAHRATAALRTADVSATARGRVAWVDLPSDPAAAAATCERAAAAVGCAVVLAVAGPRPEALEPVVADQDAIVLVLDARESLLADVARAALGAPSRAVHVVPPPSAATRVVALAGLGRIAGVRRHLQPQAVTA